jgi:cytochrome P450
MTEPRGSYIDQLQAAIEKAPDVASGARAQMQLISQWIAVSPVLFFNELRETSPIFNAPAFTLVTRHDDVQDVLTLNDIFTTDLLKQNMLKFIGNTVVELPPSPEYERRKSVLRLAFPMEDIGRYRNILLEDSTVLLGDVTSGTTFDLVSYAKQLPARAISRYLGLGALSVDQVVQWMHAINEGAVRNLANVPQINEAAAIASAEVKSLMREILENTRKQRHGNASASGSDCSQAEGESSERPTVLERYLRMQSVSTTYTPDEDIISSLLFMMSACVDLTATAITNVVVELMLRPAVLELAIAAAQKETDDDIAAYVWEALRFRQPSPGVINSCIQDYTLGRGTEYEQTLKAGTLVLGCSVAAMHDPRVIEAPQDFCIGRPKHLAYTFFEAGLHTCHGKYFSMVQIPLAVKQLLRVGHPSFVSGAPMTQGYPTEPCFIQFT